MINLPYCPREVSVLSPQGKPSSYLSVTQAPTEGTVLRWSRDIGGDLVVPVNANAGTRERLSWEPLRQLCLPNAAHGAKALTANLNSIDTVCNVMHHAR